ncbi:uncharacterized, partial [Tachysurus ichikawai]
MEKMKVVKEKVEEEKVKEDKVVEEKKVVEEEEEEMEKDMLVEEKVKEEKVVEKKRVEERMVEEEAHLVSEEPPVLQVRSVYLDVADLRDPRDLLERKVLLVRKDRRVLPVVMESKVPLDFQAHPAPRDHPERTVISIISIIVGTNGPGSSTSH